MQNEGKNKVCLLCLKSHGCTFEYVETITIETLGVLGLKLDLDIGGRPVICSMCSENLQKCVDFKTICAYTEDWISSFRNDRNDVKLDLQEIYLKTNLNKDITLSTCHTVCRLCMEIAAGDCYVALNEEAKDAMSVKAILGRCFPELDLDITKNPVICTCCNESLHCYFNFVKSCSDMENKIKKNWEIEESNNESQEDSKSVLLFSAENISHYKKHCTYVDIPEYCDENGLPEEIKLELENPAQKECQESPIKHEVNEHEEVDDVDMEKLSIAVKECCENKQNGETEIKCENLIETESLRFNIKHEEIDIKSEDKCPHLGFQDGMLNFKDASAVVIRQCKICKFGTVHENSLKMHLTHHEDISEVVMHQCKECEYKTQTKSCLDTHMLIHTKDSVLKKYQCEVCIFDTRDKTVFKQHMISHKNASELMYACGICTYKSKLKGNLNRHMHIHSPDVSEETWHSCGICTYKTKRKDVLKQHMLIHKKISEVTMYSCGICTYKTKLKGNLKKHMQIHNPDASEVTWHSCGICTYKTIYKNYLKHHMLTHKNVSDVTMYSCEICTYKGKQKRDLKRHMLIHKTPSEITVAFCGICTYKTKQKGNLKQHMLIHKSAPELTMYSCGMCSYKSKLKGNLRKHMQIHKNVSEVAM